MNAYTLVLLGIIVIFAGLFYVGRLIWRASNRHAD